MKLKVLEILTTVIAVLCALSFVGFILLPVGISFTPDPANPSISYGSATSGLVCLSSFILFLILFIALAKLSVRSGQKNKGPL